MPTIATTEAFIVDGVATTALEQRLYDTAMFLGDGSANGVRSGVVRHGDTSLAVSVNGSDQVTIQAGACVIPAGTGLGVWRGALAAASSAVGITARNSTNPRIDLVVAQATGTDITFKTIDGTPGASPSAPALPAQHIELARLTVPAVGGGAVTVDSTWRAYASSVGGTLYVETAARLPGSGNQKGQRAVALNDGIEHIWNGTAWVAQSSISSVTPSGGAADSTGTTVTRRGGLAVLNVSVTMTGALGAGGRLFYVPAGYLPSPTGPATIFGTLFSSTDVPYRVHIARADGDTLLQPAVASGVVLRGQIMIPL